MIDQKKIGAFIRTLRKEKNMTQQELADKLGVSDKAVSKWERGDGCPDVGILPTLAQALGTDVDSLLKGELKEVTQEQPKPAPRVFIYDFKRPSRSLPYR